MRERRHHRRARRRIVVATILVTIAAFFVLLLLVAVFRVAADKAQGAIKQLNAIDDILGYLHRDEQRELVLYRR